MSTDVVSPLWTAQARPLSFFEFNQNFTKWMAADQPEVFAHLADGTFRGFVYGTRGAYRVHESLAIEG